MSVQPERLRVGQPSAAAPADPVRRDRDDGAGRRFAEQRRDDAEATQDDGRARSARHVDLKPDPAGVERALGERDREAAIGAVVRGAQKPGAAAASRAARSARARASRSSRRRLAL